MNRPTHANAAKAFVNWLLSQEGQNRVFEGHRLQRVPDVSVVDQTAVVDPNRKHPALQKEQAWPTYLETLHIAKGILK